MCGAFTQSLPATELDSQSSNRPYTHSTVWFQIPTTNKGGGGGGNCRPNAETFNRNPAS